MFVKETSNIFSSFLLWLPKPDFFDQNEVIEVWFRVFWRWITNLSQIFGCFIAPVAAIALPSACVSLSSSTRQQTSRPCTIHCWWLLAVGMHSISSIMFLLARFLLLLVMPELMLVACSSWSVVLSILSLSAVPYTCTILLPPEGFTYFSRGCQKAPIRFAFLTSTRAMKNTSENSILSYLLIFLLGQQNIRCQTSSSNQLYRRISQPAIINNISPWFLAISPIYPTRTIIHEVCKYYTWLYNI